jgi:hypothetical protein
MIVMPEGIYATVNFIVSYLALIVVPVACLIDSRARSLNEPGNCSRSFRRMYWQVAIACAIAFAAAHVPAVQLSALPTDIRMPKVPWLLGHSIPGALALAIILTGYPHISKSLLLRSVYIMVGLLSTLQFTIISDAYGPAEQRMDFQMGINSN